MKRIILFLFALLLACSGCSALSETQADKYATLPRSSSAQNVQVQKIAFSPTYQSDEADKYYDAIEIYDSSPKAAQGVYHYDGLIFVIICIDTNKESIEYLEGTAMLRTVALLRQHYPALPAKFHIRNRIVEKYQDYDTGIYRYATAYREKDIMRKLRKQ